MIQTVSTRLVIEKPITHDKFYPDVISASIQQSYPFSVTGATIDVVANLNPGTLGYAAPINFDDIVRLQISVKMNTYDKTVWQDIFHGRVENMSSTFGTSNQLKLYCVGHEGSLRTDLITAATTYENVDAKTVLSNYSTYFSRLTYDASRASTGIIFPQYDTTADQTFMSTVIEDMEKQSGYDWIFTTIPTYDAAKNLSTIYTVWRPFSTILVKCYKAIEGTARLISADFDINGEGVVTTQKIYGDTPSGGTQYKGTYTDTALESRYGKRSAVDTYSWIQSNSLCTTIATGLQRGARVPVVSGQVVLTGTPEAQLGDLVAVKIPSIELNSVSIDGNYYVYRIQHDISRGVFKTTLDLGRIKMTAEDYIARVAKTVKVVKCSLVKK